MKLALYGRRALAKDAGVAPDGTGSHRIVIGSEAGPFTDPDGSPGKPHTPGRTAQAATSARSVEMSLFWARSSSRASRAAPPSSAALIEKATV